MAKTSTDEVQVLRFFENGPLEKVEAVFNIVSEKMRERTNQERGDAGGDATARRRRRRNQESGAVVSDPPQEM